MITPMLGEGQGSHHKGNSKGHGKEQYQAVDMKTTYIPDPNMRLLSIVPAGARSAMPNGPKRRYFCLQAHGRLSGAHR